MQSAGALIGNCPQIAAVEERLRRLLARGAGSGLPPVLIQGETGTGKGLLARVLHEASHRAAGPFVAVNCAAIPEPLLEAELFGFEQGAFTDARQAKPGLFQAAHRGTIFLDEVGLLPEGLQSKLLKVIEDREVRRLGSIRSEPVDVWILAATSGDLTTSGRVPRFHEALYHRLSVLTFHLPPLRERGDDVLLLAQHFLARACADYRMPAARLGPGAEAALLAHAWPGNVRELANVIERAVLLSEERVLDATSLGLPAAPPPEAAAPAPAGRAQLLAALRQTRGNVSRAAARLGISRDAMRYRMKRDGLEDAGTRRSRRSTGPSPVAGPPPPGGPVTIRWERRPLALLRSVLTAPPESAEARRGLDLVADRVRTLGGRIEELSPTVVLAVFGFESAEDAPLRAAAAALSIHQAAARTAGGDMAVTSAIHAGRFMVGEGGGTVTIDTDSRREAGTVLAELVERAEAGTVHVSDAAAALLRRRFRLVASGTVHRLLGAEDGGGGAGRRATPFVGRTQELELLRSRLAAATRDGGQVVAIAGEPGIGKSRLVQELADPGVLRVDGRCLPYGSAIPFLPLLGLLRRQWGVAETEPAATVEVRVRAGLERAGMVAEDALPVLLHLLAVREDGDSLAPLSPEALKARTVAVLQDLVLRQSRQQPLLLVLEDLHWIDRSTEEWLESLVERIPRARLLLVVTYRPGYRPAWIERSYVTQLALPALGTEDSRRLVRAFLGTAPLADPLVERLVARAEGNPLFLEELAVAMTASAAPATAPPIPDSLHGVLTARIDRLPARTRRLLQVAAVLGREAPEPLLRALWDGPLDPMVRELTRLEFLCVSEATEEPAYVFKHALTQEAAYESLPDPDRRALHGAAGQALERLFAGREGEALDRLAHHYARSDRSGLAVGYLTRVAETAARRYAHAEAAIALEEALRHAACLPAEARERRTVEVAVRLADSLYFLGRLPESLGVLQAQADRVERLGDPALAAPFRLLLGRTVRQLGDREEGVRHLQRALDDAKRAGDRRTEGKAYTVLAMEGYWAGNPRQGLEHGRRAVVLLEPTEESWWLGQSHWLVGCNHVFMGEFDRALEAIARAETVGARIGDPRIQAYATWTRGLILALSGETDAAIAACRQGVDRSIDPLGRTQALGMLGCAYLERGDAVQAIERLEESVAQLRAYRSHVRAWYTAWLGEAYLLAGQTRKAEVTLREDLELARSVKFPMALGLARRALGRMALDGGDVAGAEGHLGAARETFTGIDAGFELARTHLGLARVAHARGHGDAVVHHLDAAHRLFTGLRVVQYVERTERLAGELGVPLTSRP